MYLRSRIPLVLFILSLVSPTVACASENSQTLEMSEAAQVAVPSAETIATYPAGYFLESIVIDADGTLYISENTQGLVIQYGEDGSDTVFAQVDNIRLAGLGLDTDGTLFATGHSDTGEQYIVQFAGDGSVVYQQVFSEGGFFNGMTLLEPGVFLIADSSTGTIWRFDRATEQLSAWLQDDTLAPNPDLPDLPAANGIKLFDGSAYVSNSGRATVTQIPLLEGGQAGTPEILFSDIILDDFAFSQAGNLYGTTHINDSVVVLTPDGQQSTIATAAEGVTGSTALAFGVTEDDLESIYVIGDGGIFGAASEADIVAPELVRIEVGEVGAPLVDTLSQTSPAE